MALLHSLPQAGFSRASCSPSADSQRLSACPVRCGHSTWPQAWFSQAFVVALLPPREIERPIPELVWPCWRGYVPPNPVGFILAYQNWRLPDWVEKGKMHSQAVEHLEHLNLQHGMEVQSLFSFALRFHQPGSVPRAFMAFASKKSSWKRREVWGQRFFFLNVPQFQDLG